MMTKEVSTKMTAGAEVLMLGRSHISHIVKMHYFFKQFFSSSGKDQINQVCSNDDQERVYQNCNFHDPWDRGSCARAWPYKSYSKNALFLQKNLPMPPGKDQINQVCSNDDQVRVYQILIFMTPGTGALVLGHGHINHKVKMHYILKNPFLYSPRH